MKERAAGEMLKAMHGCILSEDLRREIFIPIWKMMRYRRNCNNYRGTNLLSISGNLDVFYLIFFVASKQTRFHAHEVFV